MSDNPKTQAPAALFDHAFDFAFEVKSADFYARDVTAAMLIAAARARIDSIESQNGGAEMLQACNCFDTQTVKDS